MWVGSWLSGYLIVATDAWMQRPLGYALGPKGEILLTSWFSLIVNEWALWQFWHTMLGGVLTASFVVAGIGAFYLLLKRSEDYGRTFLRTGVIAGTLAALLAAFPTGDQQGALVARYQPVTLAAMEGHFETGSAAPMAILGQPDVENHKLDNPFVLPGVLSFIVHKRWDAEVRGLDGFPRDTWPDNIPLLYYSFHIMVGLGTIFIALMSLSLLQLWRGKLYTFKPLLWALLLAVPLPYVANTAGWMTAELGRQPWLIYGLMRNLRRHVADGGQRQHDVHAARLYGHLHAAGDARAVPDLARARPRPGGEPLMLPLIWYAIVAVMLTVYVVLDGFDLGAGIIHLVAARTDSERRTVLASIGPVWDGNEVWLLAAGGALYFAFPPLYASSFSGFYLPLMMVLWLAILRGIAVEFRSHLSNAVWTPAFDVIFCGASALLAIFYGAALGNVVRGVPLDGEGQFFLPLWTDWRPGLQPGILDWYTVLTGLLALATLLQHGALWVAAKTEGGLERQGALHRRLRLVRRGGAAGGGDAGQFLGPAEHRPQLHALSRRLCLPGPGPGQPGGGVLFPPRRARNGGVPGLVLLYRRHDDQRRVRGLPERAAGQRPGAQPDHCQRLGVALRSVGRPDVVHPRHPARHRLLRFPLSPLRRQGAAGRERPLTG